MARPSVQPEGIPKPITPSTGPATNPVDLGDLSSGDRGLEPRPAAGASSAAAQPRAASPGGEKPSARDAAVGLPGRQPSDAAPPPDDEGPLESLGKAVSAPVREAGGKAPGGRGGAPR